MTLAEASACKLYAAQAAMEVALEAVQLFGGNGYMAEYQVEQLCRDAKVLQIYGGTDEIQVSQIARSLLSAVSGRRTAARASRATEVPGQAPLSLGNSLARRTRGRGAPRRGSCLRLGMPSSSTVVAEAAPSRRARWPGSRRSGSPKPSRRSAATPESGASAEPTRRHGVHHLAAVGHAHEQVVAARVGEGEVRRAGTRPARVGQPARRSRQRAALPYSWSGK